MIKLAVLSLSAIAAAICLPARAAGIADAASATPALSADGKVPPVAGFASCAKPVWPKAALRNEQQGTVTLAFLIDTDGKVSESRIEKSSGFPLLDLAAQEGIEKCTFRPGLENGEPAKSWLRMQYVWKLDGPNPARLQQALALAREGAARGDAESTYKLSLIYLNGSGVARDPVEAARWLRYAADQGHAKAQEGMGMLAMRWIGAANQPGTPVNADEAADWFRKAAAQDSAMGQCLLGRLLIQQRRPDEAMPWLRQSAQQNHAEAQALLAGLLFKRNDAGDWTEAVQLLIKAADQNNSFAQVGLAHAYESGFGVAQDYVQAATLYRKAALEGNAEAQLGLARLYEQGQGVPQDSVKAQQLRRIAAKPGTTIAK